MKSEDKIEELCKMGGWEEFVEKLGGEDELRKTIEISKRIKELRERGNKGIIELLKLLDNEDESVQWAAEDALEKIGEEYAQKENTRNLIKLLDNKERSIQIKAFLALAQSDKRIDKALHKLIKFLGDENWFIRKEVARIIGSIAYYNPKKAKKALHKLIECHEDLGISVKKASRKLIELLNDEKKIVQAYAIDALGGIAKEYPEEVDISYFYRLPELLDNEDVNIRYETVRALSKIAEKHPEKVMDASHKLVEFLRNTRDWHGSMWAASALEKIARTNPKEAENISNQLNELLNDENIGNKEKIAKTLENIAKELHEEKKKENKRPSGLDIILSWSTIFGVVMLSFVYILYSYPPHALFIPNLILSLGSFLLILSVIGIWFQKKIAYWSLIFAWLAIMFSGLYINYVTEIETRGFIPAGPGGFIPDLLFYGVIPIAIVFYMLAEKSKIEDWIKIENLYQLEKLVGILSGLLVFIGVIFLLGHFGITGIEPVWLATIICFIIVGIAGVIVSITYNMIVQGLIRRKSRRALDKR
jgi:HEAT repeat protein